MLGPDADHEDLVHEILLKAWRLIASGKLREPERLGSWLKTIAVHAVYKEIRRRYVRRRFLLTERYAPRLAMPHASDAGDLLRLLYRVAEGLPPAERFAFSLRHFEQRRLVDVAELMGCSLATAKRRLAQAESRFIALSRPYEAEYPALHELFASAGGTDS